MSEGQEAVVSVFTVRGFVGGACAETAGVGLEAFYEVDAVLFYGGYVNVVNAQGVQYRGGGKQIGDGQIFGSAESSLLTAIIEEPVS